MLAAGDAIAHLQDEEIWQYSKGKAKEDAENLCVRPWREAVSRVPLMVSSGQFNANRMNDLCLIAHS
jgi:hypothetical protein